MTSIKLEVTGAQAKASVHGLLTSGMVGIPVAIQYDASWNGLTKNLVCRCSIRGSDKGDCRTILDVGEAAAVAHEVMKPNMHLYLGVEGWSPDGKLVIPTIWADCGNIRKGANTGADLSADPTLPVWSQLQAQIEQIKENPFTQEQVSEIQASAQSAIQAASSAARSEENARISADSAADLADETLRLHKAAEAAAERAEAAAGSAQNHSCRDVLPGEIFVLSDDTGSGDDTGDDTGGDSGIDIPTADLMAYYDMRTPLTADGYIEDLSGNGKSLLFIPANGYYQDGYITRGDKTDKQMSQFGAATSPTDGASGKFVYGDTATFFSTFAIGENDRTPIWGTYLNKVNLITMSDGLIVFASKFNDASAGTAIPEDYTIVTAAVSLNKSGQERIYINGVLKSELPFKEGMEFGDGFWPLTGYASGGDYGARMYNAAIYAAELSTEQISAISATLLANAGGVSA